MRSVQFCGREVTLEQALDETVRGVQGKLNSLQLLLRQLAAAEEQEIDGGLEDFQMATRLEDETFDLVSTLVDLLEELPDIAHEIVGKPQDAESKAWLVTHKAERKALLAERAAAAKAKAAEEAAEQKAAKAAEKAAAQAAKASARATTAAK